MSNANFVGVKKKIEEAILSGELKPRERLVEMELTTRFGVSRSTIREILRDLERKGLVRTIRYRGAVVADLTLEEVEEIYFARAKIESITAGLVLKRITHKEIQDLKKLSKEAKVHLLEKTNKMIEADSEFHRAFFKACGNRYLYNIIDFLHTKAHIVRFNAWSLPHRIEQSIDEHREIIKAIEDRNLFRLEKLIVKHLMVSKNSYLTQLKGLPPNTRRAVSNPRRT